jgi:NADPH:quinone reductase-like Zn-dependent oxidoreductase
MTSHPLQSYTSVSGIFSMKAIIWTKYGPPDVLQVKEIEKPAPKDNEVLIKIAATTVTAGDCEMRSLRMPLYLALPMRLYIGFTKPTRITIPGQELSGEVEAVGKAVTRFKPGDPVFGTTGFNMGAYTEYICLAEEHAAMGGLLAIKPANLTHEEAAALPIGGIEALHYLRQANIQRGQQVLINGAGGSIGTIAVQFATSRGAEVTAVDSTGKLDMLRSIGAGRVIDYTHEDFTRSGETYDVIFDVAGKSPFSRSLRSLKPDGYYLLGNPSLGHRLRSRGASLTGSKKVIAGTASYQSEALIFLRELVEAGKLRPVIDRIYPLEQAAEAHRYVETRQKKGCVVVKV